MSKERIVLMRHPDHFKESKKKMKFDPDAIPDIEIYFKPWNLPIETTMSIDAQIAALQGTIADKVNKIDTNLFSIDELFDTVNKENVGE
jgi:hypothetical protein